MLTAAVDTDVAFFDTLRAREFARLDAQDLAYLDYTGSALYADSLVRGHLDRLRRRVFGNPHSTHAPSLASTHAIDAARQAVLGFFDADTREYDVCFTANTSAAIKLVAESYPFGPGRGCVLSADNHNSIHGIREYARRAHARVRYVPLDDALRLVDPAGLLADEAPHGGGLLAFPAQSNFSGVRHRLSLVDDARRLGFHVLLDVAAFAGTHAFSLRECPADAIAASCYKVCGFPTGVGVLVARRSLLAELRRPWFAGGTVDYVSVQLDRYAVKADHDGFEDGTPNFLDLAAVAPGLAWMSSVDLTRVAMHVDGLTRRLIGGLRALTHPGGSPRVLVYGPVAGEDRGNTVAFNVIAADGRTVSHEDVIAHVTAAGVACRGGCFCNPGASEAAFRFSKDIAAGCFDALGRDFSVARFASCLGGGATVGAVRMSVGVANNARDIDRALDAIAAFPAGTPRTMTE